MKRHILLVDPDTRGRRMLEVSLRKAGYTVDPVDDGEAALAAVGDGNADLVLTDTTLPGMDGFDLVARLQEQRPEIGIMFLSSDTSLKSKVRGLELGVDYLTKPAYLKEVITRVELELERRERLRFADRGVPSTSTLFKGTLQDMALVDLFQTISMGRKSGELFLRNNRQNGSIWFSEGDVVDAECRGIADPKRALLRFFLWPDGHFELRLGPVEREKTIEDPTSALIGDGMRRLDEWGRLLEQVPSLDTKLHVNANELLQWLAGLPEEINPLLRRLDGTNSLGDVIFFAQGDEIELLQRICDLYFEGVLSEYGTAVSIVPAESPASVKQRKSLAPESLPTSRPPAPRPSNMPIGATTLDYLEALEIDLSAAGAPHNNEGPSKTDSQPVPAPRPASEAPEPFALDTFDEPDTLGSAPLPQGSDGSDDSDDSGETETGDVRGRTLRPAPVLSVPPPTLEGRVVRSATRPRAPVISMYPAEYDSRAPKTGNQESDNEADFENEVETSPSLRAGRVPKEARFAPEITSYAGLETQEHTLVETPNPNAVVASGNVPAADERKPAADEKQVEAEEADAWDVEEEVSSASLSSEAVRSRVRTDPPGPMTADEVEQHSAAREEHDDEPKSATDDGLAETEEEEEFFSNPPPEEEPVGPWAEPPAPKDSQLVPMLFVGAVVLAIGVGLYAISGEDPVADSAESDVTREGIASAGGDRAALQGGSPAESQAQPPAESQAQPPAESQAQPPAETQAQPPAESQEQPPAESQEQPPAETQAQADSYATILSEAQSLLKARKRKPAEAAFRKAIEINPGGSQALADLSLMLMERNKLREAGELAERSVNIDPTNAKGWIVFGFALQSQGKRPAAMEAYRKCAQLGTGTYVVNCKRMAR